MDAMALDPAGYTGTYKLVGGRVALDFINTVSWAGTDRQYDWFSSVGNVNDWLEAVGIHHQLVTESDLEDIRRLRVILGDVIRPLARNARPSAQSVRAFNDELQQASVRRLVDPDTLRFTWGDATKPTDPFAPVVLDAGDILTGDRADRLKHCPSCDWLFDDQTRNGKRRWCDMADCGSRNKSRNYYHRSRTTS